MEFHPMRDCDAWRKQGLAMTTNSNESCKLYDAALTQCIKWYDNESYGGLEKTLDDMLSYDNSFILGHCLKNGLELIGTSGSLENQYFQADLIKFDSLVKHMYGSLSQRERDHSAAIRHLFKGDVTKACDLWEEILTENPTDLMAIKFASDAYFYTGQAMQMRDSVARVLPNWSVSLPLYSSLYGIYSFGLVQSNFFDEAKKAAGKALEMNRCDAWATHTMCHYYEYATDYDSGIQFLRSTERDWSICNMLSSHNYWHLALYHIEKSEHETALQIYNNHIANNVHLARTLDMVDAISLLFRLKLDACKTPLDQEWTEIASVYKTRNNSHGYIFNDAHIVMMLASVGNEGDKNSFMNSLNEYVSVDENDMDFLRKLNTQLASRIFKAIFSYQNNEFELVVELLHPIRYEIVKIGGSNAQRDLFLQMLIQSALRSSSARHNKLGVALLNERRAMKVNSNLTERIASRFASHDSN